MQHRHPHFLRTPDSLIGRVVSDRYRIIRKLGQPGIAGLYFAEHLLVNRNVALQIILPEVRRPDVLRAFLDQARTIARIGHENIVEIFCCGQSPDDFVFVATAYLEGENLRALLGREGPLPLGRAKAIVRQLCAALGPVHEHRIVHRDLKPENIFLTGRNGTRDFVKLLNFGVATLTTAALEEGETGSGQLCSAPAYVAPEVALAQAADHRADIYSLGCLLYEMLTGTPPFEGRSVVDVINKHIQDSPLPMRTRRPDLDIGADIDGVVMRALEKDPDRRYTTVADLAVAVEQCRSASRRLIAFAAEGVVGRDDDRRAAPNKPPATRLAKATVIAALSCAAAIATYAALHGF
ncbi:MAG TPA: serine/threonine-protein kinase [Polyangia bacterium]|jgi:serine/threonine-protein kinase|nr:serine/threonine-protein kinase [Polyangia bacterium]